MSYRRHPLEITPLVFGLVFLGIVAAWALFETGVLTGAALPWVLPVVLIGAGALGLVLAVARPRAAAAPEYAGPDDATAYEPAPATAPLPADRPEPTDDTDPTDHPEPTDRTHDEEHRHD